MRLNSMKPAAGSKPKGKRLGRGESAGQGKTSGRGQKGQKARSGGYHKTGFEGGQMPLQRRLPKIGFTSRSAAFGDEVRLHELESLGADVVDMETLLKAHLISRRIQKVKIIESGKLTRPVTVKGLKVTKGARAAIEAAGGKVED